MDTFIEILNDNCVYGYSDVVSIDKILFINDRPYIPYDEEPDISLEERMAQKVELFPYGDQEKIKEIFDSLSEEKRYGVIAMKCKNIRCLFWILSTLAELEYCGQLCMENINELELIETEKGTRFAYISIDCESG